MRFFTPPKTDYKDFYDQARFNLVWNLSFVFALFIFVLSLLSLTNEHYEPFSYLAALLAALGALIGLRMSKRYEVVSRVISIVGLVIVSYTFLGLSDVINYTTPMWLVINVLFTYFTCGRKWGAAILGLNIVTISAYFYLKFQDNIAGLPVYSDHDMHLYVVEYVIIGVIMAYFLHVFVTTNYLAEKKVRVANNRLNIHNSLISKQNEEKELMLKEIHHRVKNNLQVITSLLRLQSYEIEDENFSTKFNEAISRIKAMALIHEKMYQKEMLQNFNLESYISSLSKDLLDTYSLKRDVKFNITSSMIEVGSRTIVPLALLFNELITNSLKHAFSEVNNPLITIALSDCKEGCFKMIYKDNGKWMEGSTSSFGQELITTMTEQLEGELELIKNDSGTIYSFQLRNLKERFDELV